MMKIYTIEIDGNTYTLKRCHGGSSSPRYDVYVGCFPVDTLVGRELDLFTAHERIRLHAQDLRTVKRRLDKSRARD